MELVKPHITKEWLANKLQDQQQREKVIGRALLAIYKNQTMQEQDATCTTNKNGIGFCKPDARVGSIGARMYKAHGKLATWVIDVWMRPAKDGMPRICKYWQQLDQIAKLKAQTVRESKVAKNIFPIVVML
jgi:hypothetical protein